MELLALTLSAGLITVRIEAFIGVTVARSTGWRSPPTPGTLMINPVLAVLPVVVVSAVTNVSMGRAGLPVAVSLILTWIQMTGVSAAFPIITRFT